MSDVGEAHGSLLAFDHNSHFELQSDDSAMTYRMLQVVQDDDGQSHIVEAGTTNAVSMPATDNDINAAGPSTKIFAQTSGGQNQYFVMMSPNDLTTGQRGPRGVSEMKMSANVMTRRDDRRKATHKEVERRRRDKINTWIGQLAQLVPDCAGDMKLAESKCIVLSKACEYIATLQNANDSLSVTFNEVSAASADVADLRRQYNILQAENQLLWTELQNNGIEPPITHADEINLDDE